MVASLDIEGALTNVNPSAIIDALSDLKVDKSTAYWSDYQVKDGWNIC